MRRSSTMDHDLRVLVLRLARVYLEVERGLRSPDQLRNLLTPHEYRRHRVKPRYNHFPKEGPVVPRDIRGLHLDTSVPGKLSATVTTREHGDRWGELVLHFRRNGDDRTWKADKIERLFRDPRAMSHHRHEPTRADASRHNGPATDPGPRSPASATDLDARIERVLAERHLVEAARQAATHDLTATRDPASAKGNTTSQKPVRQLATDWSRRLGDLDAELAGLRRTKRLRERIARLDVPVIERRDTEATRDPLKKLLGPRPEEAEWAQLWDVAAEAVRDYRERWNITDIRTALGPAAPGSEQGRDRARLTELLRTVGPRLFAHSRMQRGKGLSSERHQQTGLDPDREL